MNKFAMGAVALGLLAMGSTGASAANLIQNGGFTQGNHDLAHWLLTGVALDNQDTHVINYTNGQNFPTGPFGAAVPQDPYGTSANGVYFVSDRPVLVSLTQVFDVATAGDYTISFDIYAPQNGRNNPLDAMLGSGAGSLGNFTTLANIGADSLNGNVVDGVTPDQGWYKFTFNEDLNAGFNAIIFKYNVKNSVRNPQTAADFILTNVSVAGVVPEPATWGMMLLGFFGLGAMVRRRTATTAALTA